MRRGLQCTGTHDHPKVTPRLCAGGLPALRHPHWLHWRGVTTPRKAKHQLQDARGERPGADRQDLSAIGDGDRQGHHRARPPLRRAVRCLLNTNQQHHALPRERGTEAVIMITSTMKKDKPMEVTPEMIFAGQCELASWDDVERHHFSEDVVRAIFVAMHSAALRFGSKHRSRRSEAGGPRRQSR